MRLWKLKPSVANSQRNICWITLQIIQFIVFKTLLIFPWNLLVTRTEKFFLVACLSTKNQIQSLHPCHIGLLNVSIFYKMQEVWLSHITTQAKIGRYVLRNRFKTASLLELISSIASSVRLFFHFYNCLQSGQRSSPLQRIKTS